MFQSSFLFTYIIINTEGGFINTKLVFSIVFALCPPICLKFTEMCQTDVKILYSFQKNVSTYGRNLIYDVRLQVNGEIDMLY